MLLLYCSTTLYSWLLLLRFSMEYSGFAGMAGSNCGTCVAEARQSKPRRRTSRKTAQNELLHLEPGAEAFRSRAERRGSWARFLRPLIEICRKIRPFHASLTTMRPTNMQLLAC